MLSESQREELAYIARRLPAERHVLVITGAGMSADSGLPTYRGIGGLYNDEDPEEGIPIEVALSGAMFRSRPELTWKHIMAIEKACRGASPNRGHEVLAELERYFERFLLLTQNVDGLHQEAGTREIIDIHGDVHELLCTSCDWRERVTDYAELEACPRCPECGAVVRPDVVLFGEMLPVHKTARLTEELERGFDVVISIGTTSVFPYIAGPVWMAARSGKITMEINPSRTEVTDVVLHRIRAGAATTLDALWSLMKRR